MQASPELRIIIEKWFASWEQRVNGKLSWADNHLSHIGELCTIGTDPGEWFEGNEAFEHMKREMDGNGEIKFSVGEIEAYEEGSVSWGTAHPILTISKGKQVRIRWSAVFHLEENAWKMVQLHMSVGIPNEQLLEQDKRNPAASNHTDKQQYQE